MLQIVWRNPVAVPKSNKGQLFIAARHGDTTVEEDRAYFEENAAPSSDIWSWMHGPSS